MAASESQARSAPYFRPINEDGSAGGGLASLLLSGESQSFYRVFDQELGVSIRLTASGIARSGAAILQKVIIVATGVITAGTITVYNNTAASGTIIIAPYIPVGAAEMVLPLNTTVTNGVYVDFGTTANLQVVVTYLAAA